MTAASALMLVPQRLKSVSGSAISGIATSYQDIFSQFSCLQWFRDAKFGLWLHWGPQSIPAKGGGWYARNMYMEDTKEEWWGKDAWQYHRDTYGHQSEVGYKELCNMWKVDDFDTEATVKLFKKWGARYVATMGNHHDNYDLFNTTVHKWNSINVGPKRDLVGEFAAAAQRRQLKWAISIHCARAKSWFAPAFGSDTEGAKKGIPYDGWLTKEDGRGKWWEGLDPQQLYAHKYAAFDREAAQRHLEMVTQYQPDLIYFDDGLIPQPMVEACEKLYRDSLQKNGSIQAVVTVKSPQQGTVLDIEQGVTEELRADYWQTCSTLADHWFLKPNPDGSSNFMHNVRSLKELLVDIVSKRGVLLMNVAVRADGSIPSDQYAVMEEFGDWLKANGEAIYDTEPWKTHGEGGATFAGSYNERGVKSEPWDHRVLRFTCNKTQTVLYVHTFGNPAGKEVVVGSLAADKGYFSGKIKHVSLIGGHAISKWSMKSDGLHVVMPDNLTFKDCNILKIQIT